MVQEGSISLAPGPGGQDHELEGESAEEQATGLLLDRPEDQAIKVVEDLQEQLEAAPGRAGGARS